MITTIKVNTTLPFA